MRALHAVAAAFVLGFGSAAWAAPVALAPVTFAPKLQTEINDALGPREGVYLQQVVTRAVSRALVRSGAEITPSGPITIELTVVDAAPNHPTFDQLSRPPYPDMSSVSIGGAELHAVLRGADGQTLREVSYRQYDPMLDEFVFGSATWTAAHRAIDRFAQRVADAYVAEAGAN